jgi:signal transduction histidine kinase
MNTSLRLRFIFAYLIVALFTLFLLNTYGYHALCDELTESEQQKLYEEAELIVKDYIPSMSILDTADTTLRKHFTSLETLTNMRVWIVSASGDIAMDSNLLNSCQGKNINRYDESFLSNQSLIGKRPKELVAESMISVIYPITESLNTSGYVVLMSPTSALNDIADSYIDSILVGLLLILTLFAILFLHLYRQCVVPLKELTTASRKYANGYFDYPMEKMHSREQAGLSEAIQYLAEQTKAQNEYQKNFIANVSHDFRSPLTSIKGYTEALSDGTIPPEMQEKYFNIILFEVERLTKLTGNLLELSRLNHGTLMLDLDFFDINAAIKKASASFEQRCTQKKIALDLIFEKKEQLVYADIARIQQVIQNLLDNAIKFSSNDSTIEIRTLQKNHKVFVSIKDYGIGISKKSQSQIWNRFYKTDLSRGKDKTGTGLGLSITKEIIDAHGENINVISTEGVGTEFIFSLPAKD